MRIILLYWLLSQTGFSSRHDHLQDCNRR